MYSAMRIVGGIAMRALVKPHVTATDLDGLVCCLVRKLNTNCDVVGGRRAHEDYIE